RTTRSSCTSFDHLTPPPRRRGSPQLLAQTAAERRGQVLAERRDGREAGAVVEDQRLGLTIPRFQDQLTHPQRPRLPGSPSRYATRNTPRPSATSAAPSRKWFAPCSG